jgi:hypothetical protein
LGCSHASVCRTYKEFAWGAIGRWVVSRVRILGRVVPEGNAVRTTSLLCGGPKHPRHEVVRIFRQVVLAMEDLLSLLGESNGERCSFVCGPRLVKRGESVVKLQSRLRSRSSSSPVASNVYRKGCGLAKVSVTGFESVSRSIKARCRAWDD